MEKGNRRKHSKAKAKQRSKQLPAGPTSLNDLPDELIDAVLLNLGSSPLHLIRAAATCRRWRHAIADAAFLARSRALHGAPPVAGRYYVKDRPPTNPAVFVPSSPAVIDSAHFSLDFLYVPPKVAGDYPCKSTMYYFYSSIRVRHNRSREIIDSRDSLLLLTNRPYPDSVQARRRFPDFIVCEPVSRRYQGITRPADLSHLLFFVALLLDGAGAGVGDAMSNFKVLSVLYESRWSHYGQLCRPRACVFSPGSDGGWRIGRDTKDGSVEVPDMEKKVHFAGRTAQKLYWGMESSRVLVLDESTLKFSLLAFPAQGANQRATSFRVIGGVDGGDKLRVVRTDGEDLDVFSQLPDSGVWVKEDSIILKYATAELPGWEDWFFWRSASIVTVDNTFVVLTPGEKRWFFSVDVETMDVENEHVRNRNIAPLSYPCALPWPPVLRACVNHGDATGKRRHTRQRCSP